MEMFQKIEYIETGEPLLDECLKGGFVSNGAYIVASEKKAGKSSLVRKILFNFLSLGRSVFLIDTEQTELEVIRSMLGIALRKPKEEITQEDFESAKPILENLICLDSVASSTMFEIDGDFNFDLLEKEIEKKVTCGAEIVIYDNVTGLGAVGSVNQRIKLMGILSRIARKLEILVLVVGHTPSKEVDTLTKEVLDRVIETEQYDDLLNLTKRIVHRPANPFGGSVTSQFDGVLMVWRPMQYFSSTRKASISWLIMEESRHTEPFNIRLNYDGRCGLFEYMKIVGKEDMGALEGWKGV